MALKPIEQLLATVFRIKKPALQFDTGAILKESGGVIQARNSADAAFAKVEGADPTVDDDFVTKRYGDANYGAASAAKAVKLYELSGTTSTVTGTATIPANSDVIRVAVFVSTALDGTTPTISVGTTTSAAAFVAAADIDATVANDAYYAGAPIDVGGSAVTPRVTVAGTGITTGAWSVEIEYVETPAT